MAITIYDRVAGVRALNGNVIRSFASLAFDGMFQNLFNMGRDLFVPEGGDWTEWDEVIYPKTAAPFTGPSSPATMQQLQDTRNRSSKLAVIKQKKFIPAKRLRRRGAGSLLPNASQVIEDEQLGLLKKINTSRELMCAKILQEGGFDASTIPGNQLDFTLDFSVQTLNASSKWSTPTTKLISEEIPRAYDQFFENARMEPGKVILDKKTKRSIRGNTEVQTWLAPVRGENVRRLQADAIVGPAQDAFELDGLTYMVNRAGYDNASGNLTRYLPDGKTIWLPGDAMLGDVLGHAEGWGDIPVEAIGNADGVIDTAPQPGAFSYATSSEDPVGINLYVGAVFLFVVCFPQGVMVLDTESTS